MVVSVPTSDQLHVHAFRILPNEKLKESLQSAAKNIANAQRSTKALFLLTAVGSLRRATIRLAHASKDNPEQNAVRTWDEKFEIVSLVGTLTPAGECHLHISLSDENGRTIGGHLMDGCVVFTTVEVVFGSVGTGLEFRREIDNSTGFKELVVRSLSGKEEVKSLKSSILFMSFAALSVFFVLYQPRIATFYETRMQCIVNP